MIRLSIIIPVYNVQDYLPQCMESVLRQIGDDQEVVLVDDGSTDTCPQICDQYVAEHDCVRVVHQSNQGLSSARNMGMRHANGEYLLFLDSDDILLPEAIKRIEVALEQCVNADAIMFSYAELDVDGKVGPTKGLIPQLRNGLYTAESEELHQIVRDCLELWPAWKTVICKEMVTRERMKFVDGKIHEDVDWTSRVLLLCNNLAYFDTPIIGYRIIRDGAITSSIKYKNFDHTFSIVHGVFDFMSSARTNSITAELSERLSQACFPMLRAWIIATNEQKQLMCQRIKSNSDMLRHSHSLPHVCFYYMLHLVGPKLAMEVYKVFLPK